MKIAIATLGCKVNQYETQAIETELTRRGHQLVPFSEAADAYILNTCTVTAVSDHTSRQTIHRPRSRTRTLWWPSAAATPRPPPRRWPPWGWTW